MTLTRILAVLWTSLTFLLHSIPRYQLEQVPGGGMMVESSGPDKIAHAALFAVLGVLWSLGFPRRLGTVLAVGAAYGLVLELYQGWLIPGRTCSGVDALSDAIGLGLGILAARFLPGTSSRDLQAPGTPAGGETIDPESY
jgi:VanZ family protein